MALDLDQADCRATAEAMAREASALGRRPLPDVAWRVYLRCMAGKGWVIDKAEASDSPLLSSTEHGGSRGRALSGNGPGGRGLGRSEPLWQAKPSQSLASASGCTDAPRLVGCVIEPPEGFVLMDSEPHALGSATACSYSYRGPQGAILRLEVQRSAGGFLPTAAPVEPDFLLVDRGRDAGEGLELAWAVAVGRRNGVDVLAFSAFALSGNVQERLAVTVAAPLATDAGPVQSGLRMPHGRRETALEMARDWRAWLASFLSER